MHTNRQTLGYLFTTAGTDLTCTVRGNLNYHPASFFRFAGQDAKELAPRAVRYRLAQVPVAYHASDIQRLNVYGFVILNIVIGRFMQKVPALIGYLLMCTANQHTGFASPIGTTLFSGKTALPPAKKPFGCPEVSRVSDAFAVGINTKRLYADIYAELPVSVGILPYGHIVAGKGYEPPVTGSPADRDRLDVSLNRSAEKQFKPANVLDVEIAPVKCPAGLFKSKAAITVTAPESWKPGLFTCLESPEESFKRFVQALNYILETLRSHCLVFRKHLLQGRKLDSLIIPGKRDSAPAISVYSLFKGSVVKATAQIKPPGTVGLCRLANHGFVKIGASHYLLCSSMYFRMVSDDTCVCTIYEY